MRRITRADLTADTPEAEAIRLEAAHIIRAKYGPMPSVGFARYALDTRDEFWAIVKTKLAELREP
jgi:hypothetical protein